MADPERVFAHSSIKEYENDGDDEDRYYLPWRITAEVAARQRLGQKVMVILPRRQGFEEYLELLEKELLGGQEINRWYTQDRSYLMDSDIRRELLGGLLEMTNGNTVLHPYQATDEFYSWSRVLQVERGVRIYADRSERGNKFWWGHKGAYHRWLDDISAMSFAERTGLPTPRGFIARSLEEALQAADYLRESVVLKPIFGAGGFRIGFCSNMDEICAYEWPVDALTDRPMPVAVQERLQIEKDLLGERIFSLQFAEGAVLGRLTRQIIINEAQWCGNIVPAEVSPTFELECYDCAARLLSAVRPVGDGGIDLADVAGRPVILEVNGGRPTGAHVPKRFQEAFVPGCSHFAFEKVSVANYTAHEVWDKLRCHEGVALCQDRQSGVFPIIWLYQSWGMLASFGHSSEEALVQLERAREIISL